MRRWRLVIAFHRFLYFRGQMLAYICTAGAPIYRLITIPVRAMAGSFATFAAARFSTITDLLVVSDLAIHRQHSSSLRRKSGIILSICQHWSKSLIHYIKARQLRYALLQGSYPIPLYPNKAFFSILIPLSPKWTNPMQAGASAPGMSYRPVLTRPIY